MRVDLSNEPLEGLRLWKHYVEEGMYGSEQTNEVEIQWEDCVWGDEKGIQHITGGGLKSISGNER